MRKVSKSFRVRMEDLWGLWMLNTYPFIKKWAKKFGSIYETDGECVPVFGLGEPEAYDTSDSGEEL